MKGVIGILITSRNNYEFMEKYWIPNINKNNNIDQFEILNIDEDSSKEQKKIGKEICLKSNISYMDREERGIHHNLLTACNYFEPKGVKFVMWFQTDAWPVQNNFFNSLNKMILCDSLDQFGTLGFNGIDSNRLGEDIYRNTVKQVRHGKRPLCVVGRSSLEKGDPWICGIKTRKCKHPVDPKYFVKPFAVSINNWCASGLNIAKFRKHIDVSRGFHFFHGWDDICLQFCQNNVYNIILPTYYVAHDQQSKREMSLPATSVRLAYKKNDTYHSLVGFTGKEWKRQWGYDWDDRKTFRKVETKYKGTYLVDFYHHNMQNGPLKTFDITNSEYSEE